MAKYEVVLADPDFRYVFSLGSLLLREYGDEIILRIITDKEFLRSYFSSPQQVTLLVTHSDFWDEDLGKQYFSAAFVLTENPDEKARGGFQPLYKYTDSRDIYNAISNKLKQFVLDRSLIGTRIITIYSTQGGCGKTTLAYGLSAAIDSFGNRVLYMNTESTQIFGRTTRSDGWADDRLPMELLSGNITEKTLLGSIKEGHPDVLKPLKYSFFSCGIVPEYYENLVNHIKEKKLYDFIIIDASRELNRANAELMEMSDKVLLVITQDGKGVDNYQAMKRNLDLSDSEKYITTCAVYDEARSVHAESGEENLLSVKVPLSETDREGNPDWKIYLPLAYDCV